MTSPSPSNPPCPKCGDKLRLIVEEKRYFCDRCQNYPGAGERPAPKQGLSHIHWVGIVILPMLALFYVVFELVPGCKSKQEAPSSKGVLTQAEVKCSPGPGLLTLQLILRQGISCSVQHVSGVVAKVCWDVVYSCKNGTKVKSDGCQRIKPGQTVTKVLTTYTGARNCDVIVAGEVASVRTE